MSTHRITRLLVANRGEITLRILQACRELPNPPETYALYSAGDSTHITLGRPDHAVRIPGPAAYMDVDYLIGLVKELGVDAVHPGYGFLSESAEFARRVAAETEDRCRVVGPGWQVLERTGDKLAAKRLAEECGVPVLRAMREASGDVAQVRDFVAQVGFPVMIKAVDGGGGRGIRLVEGEDVLQNAVERCMGESPSGKVFAEQAAVHGYKHVEVQIVGDGKGGVRHLWERDCSVQRRFQKIVEVAPAPVQTRSVVVQAIEAAVKMASSIKYLGLGTWEFLLNSKEGKFFFLEINPRLQVEHTITEGITGVDLVREQLLLAQNLRKLDDIRPDKPENPEHPPPSTSIQLRLCAEDPNANFALSIGKVTEVQFPSGNGVRVDSHLSKGGSVGSDFDNLMAKIIVTASTWDDAVLRAQRALSDTRIVGVKSNLNLLRAIVADETFRNGDFDTQWLEKNIRNLVQVGNQIESSIERSVSSLPDLPSTASSRSGIASSGMVFRKGDAWSLTLEDPNQNSGTIPPAHLSIDRVIRNEFPDALVTDISYTFPGAKPQTYKATLTSTKSSAESASSTHRRGDVNNKSHIVLPMSGKLIEVLVEEGDEIVQNQVIAFVKQMKMELEIRSPRGGRVSWVIELENEDGDDVAEGVLLAELEESPSSSAQSHPRSKL